MRRTKIIGTLGPATGNVEIIKKLINAGLDGARVNFSHGDYESHTNTINMLKQAREELNRPVPLILDTKGPEIRIKAIPEGEIYLERGDNITLTTRDIDGDRDIVAVTYTGFAGDVSVGGRVLIDDGLIELKILDIQNTEVMCEIINGGNISSNKGVNLPDVSIKLPSLTEKDISDIKFGIEMGFDFIAASFIRSANDIINIRKVLEENNGTHMQIIAKIENREGVENIDEILEVTDGIMVARGDLGVEIPPEEVPVVQKRLIAKANDRSKLVVTATQMLDSMIQNPRPTRAEASDVANAIYDRTDVIMLSGETAKGLYPVEAVAMMNRIAEESEANINYLESLSENFKHDGTSITNAISYAACTLAAELRTTCISVVTKSGYTAKMISRFKPTCPVSTSTFDPIVWRQMNLYWGCVPVIENEIFNSDEVFDLALKSAMDSKLAKNGDTIVIAVGVPVGITGSTNTLRVDIVGDVLFKGHGTGNKVVTGKAVLFKSLPDLELNFKKGDILVASTTTNAMMPFIKKAGAVVIGPIDQVENSHTEIVCNALEIPSLMCNGKVATMIEDGSIITVDTANGHLYVGARE